MAQFNFIDLFAGCGGFSEGFYQEGFKSLVHVDFDEAACLTLKERMKFYGYDKCSIDETVICGELTKVETSERIAAVTKNKSIDVLVGGPPFQSFSSVGRTQDPNSMKDNPTNYLFNPYLWKYKSMLVRKNFVNF